MAGEVICLSSEPAKNANRVQVHGISPSTPPQRIRTLLSDCGPLNYVCIHDYGDRQWAIAQFFSRIDFERCLYQLAGFILDGRRITVVKSAPKELQEAEGKPKPLSITKLTLLLNRFLGVAGWSNEILELRRLTAYAKALDSDPRLEEGLHTAAYSARVSLRFVCGATAHEVVGVSQAAAAERGLANALSRAQKLAVSDAILNAAAQMAIVRLDSERAIVCNIESFADGGEDGVSCTGRVVD